LPEMLKQRERELRPEEKQMKSLSSVALMSVMMAAG